VAVFVGELGSDRDGAEHGCERRARNRLALGVRRRSGSRAGEEDAA
jgi:hypothetical protein